MTAPDEGSVAALSLLLRRAAREHLGLTTGDYWPSDVADAQARAVLASPALADLLRAERVRVLREAASDVVADCTNQPGPCICVSREWILARAEREAGA